MRKGWFVRICSVSAVFFCLLQFTVPQVNQDSATKLTLFIHLLDRDRAACRPKRLEAWAVWGVKTNLIVVPVTLEMHDGPLSADVQEARTHKDISATLHRNSTFMLPARQVWVFRACKHVLARVFWQLYPRFSSQNPPLSSSCVCFIGSSCSLKCAFKSQQWSWLCM